MKGSEQDDGRVTTVYFILAKLEFIPINFSYIRSHYYYAQVRVQATKIIVLKKNVIGMSCIRILLTSDVHWCQDV